MGHINRDTEEQLGLDRALRQAARRRGGDDVALLLRAGADPDAVELDRDHPYHGYPALHLAVRGRNAEALEALLPVADLSARSPDGLTPLMQAAHDGHAPLVAALLPVSDPAWEAQGNGSALHAAFYGGNSECVKLLLPHRDPLKLDALGRGCLHHAALSGSHEVVAMAMALAHCEPMLADNQGVTAWMSACRVNSMESMAMLRPVSDALARDKKGLRGSGHARAGRHPDLADALAGEERALEEALALRASLPETPLAQRLPRKGI